MDTEKESTADNYTELIIDDYDEAEKSYSLEMLSYVQCMICLVIFLLLCVFLFVYPGLRGTVADMFEEISHTGLAKIIKETFYEIKSIVGR